MDRVLRSLGLPAWFRHAYFEYHAHVRLRFKLAAGLGEPWTRDGSVPQGCPLSMMFIVALYLSWCKYLGAQCGRFLLSSMLITPGVCVGILSCCCVLPGLLLGTFDWLARSLLSVGMSLLRTVQGRTW